MEEMTKVWNSLPKTIKVFVYLVVSIILSEALIEIAHLDQGFLVRVSAQVINLTLVVLEEGIPAIKTRLTKK